MRMLGLLGGMSWESTSVYYRLINQGVAQRCGGLASAPLLLHSVNFDTVAQLQREARWDDAGAMLGHAAVGLERAGAQGLLIATNTMHKVAPLIQQHSHLPLLHIGDATGQALQRAGRRRVGLLGTRFTMEDAFLRQHLEQHFELRCEVPAATDRDEVHRIIFEELCQGRLVDAARQRYRQVISQLADRGCDAVVLACTEISLLIDPAADPWPVPLFDTTALHAQAAVDWITGDTP